MKKDITIFVSGLPESGKTTIAREISRVLFNQGFVVDIQDENGISPLNQDHFKVMRALKDKETEVGITTVRFNNERIKELMEREGKSDDVPAILQRVHWGDSNLSKEISPGKQYLVLLGDKWYTGTFRLKADQNGWCFVDMDEGVMTQHFEGKKRYDLEKESRKQIIKEIYEIIK